MCNYKQLTGVTQTARLTGAGYPKSEYQCTNTPDIIHLSLSGKCGFFD